MRRPGFPAPVIPWLVLVCGLAMYALLMTSYQLDPSDANLAWVVVVLLVIGPAVGDLRAFAVGAAVMGVSFVVAGAVMGVPDLANWTLVATACLVIGGILLWRRVVTLDALADARDLTEELATHDQLTGALNRHGLSLQTPTLLATARRMDIPVFVAFVDVRGLKAANDGFGHQYGDQVLAAVARALRSGMRESDLIGRWSGDEFIVFGLGNAPTEAEIEERVRAHAQPAVTSGVGWAGRVTAGCATGAAAEGLDGLIAKADAQMYERRRWDGPRASGVGQPEVPRA
jgi:diguanylate cyclase (GGDEF)-like protein